MTPPLNPEQSAMVRLAHRAIAPTLDTQPPNIVLKGQGRDRSLELPPQAWALMMQVLQAMGQCRAVMLVPDKSEFSIQDAADYLAVSAPFVLREVEAGRLPHVVREGSPWIPYPDLETYEHDMRERQEEALQVLSDLSQEIDPTN